MSAWQNLQEQKMSNLLIVGAGGHGKVVAEAALAMQTWQRIAFLDNRYPELSEVLSLPVVGSDAEIEKLLGDFSDVIVAVGDNVRRFELNEIFSAAGFNLATIIHPRACVSPSANIAVGSVIFANAVINAQATVGPASIINSAAVIEHDCQLGKAVHISPQATLAGGVKVGDYCWVGMGASVIQQVQLGNHVTIGAGSVLLTDVADTCRMAGVPAAEIS